MESIQKHKKKYRHAEVDDVYSGFFFPIFEFIYMFIYV